MHNAHSLEGLIKIEFGPPLESTAARAKGYNAGLIAVLEKPDDVKVYAEHPVHQKCVIVVPSGIQADHGKLTFGQCT